MSIPAPHQVPEDEELEAFPARRSGFDLTPVILGALVVLLFVAPFPLGANRPWAWTPLAIAVAALTVVFAWALALGWCRLAIRPVEFLPVAIPWLAVMAWAAIQIWVPWPQAPGGALWRAVAEASATAAPVSVDPQLSRVALMRLIAYGLVFFLALQLARRRGGATALLMTVAIAGVVAAVFAIFNHAATGSLYILGYERLVHPRAPLVGMSGPFVYPNAFGAYALMAAVAVVILIARRARREPRPPETSREKLLIWFLGRGGRNLPLTIALLLLLLAMAWTGSRTVLFASIGTFAVLLLGLTVLGGRTSLVPAIGALIAFGALALFAGTRLSSRIAFVDEGFAGRGRLVEQAVGFIEQSPILGWGLGAFRRLWPLVRVDDQFARFDEVHSTLVEFVLELGIPAALLLGLAFAIMAGTFAHALLVRRRGRLFAIFGLTLLALGVLHSALDFTMQMPANAATFAALLGLAYGRSLPAGPEGGRSRRIRDGGP